MWLLYRTYQSISVCGICMLKGASWTSYWEASWELFLNLGTPQCATKSKFLCPFTQKIAATNRVYCSKITLSTFCCHNKIQSAGSVSLVMEVLAWPLACLPRCWSVDPGTKRTGASVWAMPVRLKNVATRKCDRFDVCSLHSLRSEGSHVRASGRNMRFKHCSRSAQHLNRASF